MNIWKGSSQAACPESEFRSLFTLHCSPSRAWHSPCLMLVKCLIHPVYCCHSAQFLMQNSHSLLRSSYYFILKCTGNVRLMADFCPWDSRGGVMENKVWDKSKPKMGIYTMSDTDITWPENLLWIYLLQKKLYDTKTSRTTIMSLGQKIHIIHFLRTQI